MNHYLSSCLVALLLLVCGQAWALNCTPDDITLTSQAEVDNFQANHGPGCDTVVASLTIEGASINDLGPLAGLTSVSTVGPFGYGTRMQINSTSLTSLAGLENLSNVFWFELNNNTLLTSISALSNLVTVRGPLFINGNTSLTNLDGLDNLTALPGGALFIENNSLLTDLTGVSNIQSINASLVVGNNDALLDLDKFAGLSQVSSNISVSNNQLLTNIGGLGGLINFSAGLDIRYNPNLSSLGDLSNFDRLNGLVIWNNAKLSHLDGLSNVTHIGDGTSLALGYNNLLSNIEGLSNLVSVKYDVEITNNPMLDDCSPLRTLLDSIDDAEPGPGPGVAGVPDVGGDVTLANNLPGCNALPEPIVGSFAYGGFGYAQSKLLFKGLNITLNCFDTPLQIPNHGTVAANRLQFACSGIQYMDTDTLVYDVAVDSCEAYQDFSAGTGLLIDGTYLAYSNTGASLQNHADSIFQQDESAVLFFDPQSGELHRLQSMVCAQPGPPLRIFKDGFE